MKVNFKILVAGLLMVLLLSACGAKSKGVSYTLKTNIQDGNMVIIGVGGDIDGQVSPTLTAKVGDTVNITLTSGDGVEHDISFPDFNATSARLNGQGSSVMLSFVADKSGTFTYSCTVPGHADAGMKGTFEVAPAQ